MVNQETILSRLGYRLQCRWELSPFFVSLLFLKILLQQFQPHGPDQGELLRRYSSFLIIGNYLPCTTRSFLLAQHESGSNPPFSVCMWEGWGWDRDARVTLNTKTEQETSLLRKQRENWTLRKLTKLLEKTLIIPICTPSFRFFSRPFLSALAFSPSFFQMLGIFCVVFCCLFV